eukprot:TRINITY_DN3138_c0_g1_i2.p1 TRINITY_DN3138_c0_g1~~TRINITY_DN3138_c0_g1_i2.p1  ORF type:complete len:560 (+),score=151.30 TRINITY_DN3138_c0_g1_i2:63-1742(+)
MGRTSGKDEDRRGSRCIDGNQAFVAGDFTDVTKLVDLATRTDSYSALATIAVNFCQVYEKLQPFLVHLLKSELETTNHPATLFRQDTFLVSVLNAIMFSDLGMKYLQLLAKPLVADVIARSSEGLKIKEGTIEEKEEASLRLIQILQGFLDRFAATPFSCPILLRESFGAVQRAVEEKFSTSDDAFGRAPLVLDMIFFKFICPALIAPMSYKLCESVPEQAQADLLNVSKILNDFAMKNQDKPWGDTINKWIASNHHILIEKVRLLTDPRQIEEHKVVVASSVSPVPISEQQRLKSKNDLIEFFQLQQVKASDQIETIADLRSTGPQHLRVLQGIMGRSDWVIKKDRDGITSSECKIPTKFKDIYYFKSEFEVSVPIEFLAKWILAIQISTGFSMTVTKGYFSDGDFSAYRTLVKLTFPFSNREIIRGCWNFQLEDGTVWLPGTDVPTNIAPTSKGCLRNKGGASGTALFPVTGGKTRIVVVTDISGEHASKWERKLGRKVIMELIPQTKKKVIDAWRDPQTLPKPMDNPAQVSDRSDDSPSTSSLSLSDGSRSRTKSK